MFKPDPKPAKDMDLKELEEYLKSQHPDSFYYSFNQPSSQPQVEKLEEQIKFLQEQCNFARSETKRVQDQYDIDKENWALEVQHLKKLLQKGSSDESLKLEVKKSKQLVKDLQQKIETLNSELFSVKKDLEQLRSSSNKKINALEGLIEKLKKKESALNKRLEEKPKTGRKEKNPSLKNSRSGSSFIEKAQINLSFDKPAVNETLKKEIEITEKGLLELTGKYKSLVSRSESGEIVNIRDQISELTEELEKKNKYLFDLKKRHQSMIRESIKRLDST